MAKMTVKGLDDIVNGLSAVEEAGLPIVKASLYEGAAVVADQIKAGIGNLPVDTPRWLSRGDRYNALVAQDKEDLANSMGIMKFERDADGVRTVIGFAGYGRHKTKKYPRGLPMAMIARSIESGSSVRRKHPFVRTAVNASKARGMATIKAEAETRIREVIKKEGL